MDSNAIQLLTSAIHTLTRKRPVEEFLKFPVSAYEHALERKPETFWQTAGEQNALQLFHLAATSVPAYRDFLKKHRIAHEKIKTIADFSLVPPTDKANYIQAYPLASRCMNGTLSATQHVIATSSGTSGNPNFWPRGTFQEFEAAVTHELLFKNLFNIHKRKTLAVIGFPMGVYVSGMATALPLLMLAQKNYPLTVMTPGNNKAEVLKAVKQLHHEFDQIILIGHPFFIKDVLETGTREKIVWKNLNVNLLFCSEGFTEEWRDYVLHEAGLKSDPVAAFNTYGSSEMLLMAYETPFSIAIRRAIAHNSNIAAQFTGATHSPNIFQYNPALRFIEQLGSELLFTANSGVPLIRFNLHDTGTIIPFDAAHRMLGGHRTSLPKHVWHLPLVTVTGRSDQAVIYYAANIYPQHIVSALHHRQLLPYVTGKFTLRKIYNKKMDEFLEVHIELKPDTRIPKKLTEDITRIVVAHLEQVNMEYLYLRNNLSKDLRPKIKLWTYQHTAYFKPGLKPKYIQTA